MSSITEATAKTSDELKQEVDAALAMVGDDLSELKEDLSPQHILNEVILQDKFAAVQKGFNYLLDRPLLLTGIGLVAGVVLSFTMPRKTHLIKS